MSFLLFLNAVDSARVLPVFGRHIIIAVLKAKQLIILNLNRVRFLTR